MKQAKEFFLRRIAAVLAILMVVVMLPIGTPATATETVPQEEKTELAAVAPEKEVVQTQGITADGLEYEVYSDYVEIFRYNGSATELVIPSEIDGLPVKSINYYGIWGCENLVSISFPATITSFHGLHFASCKNVQNIYVDEENPYYCTVDGVLYDKEMTRLCAYPKGRQGSFVIPDSVTYLGSYAFDECTKLTGITIPGSVVEAGWNVFYGCSSLTKVTIPGSLEVVEEYMFENCTGLSSVTIGSGITCISNSAFAGCSNLTSVNIPESVTTIGSDSGWEGAFERCTSLQSITLPSNLKRIDCNTFWNCSSLQSISIPASVTDLGDKPFYGCSSMNSIQVASGNGVYTSKDGILYDKDMTELIYCPDNKQGSVTVPNGVAEIKPAAFANCAALTGIKLPDTVTSVGWSTFQNCSNLTSINIPDGITAIEYDMFNGCKSLASINIPDSVTSIESSAFSDCVGLTSVSLPDGLRSISTSAFSNCTSLKSIEIPDTVTYLGAFSFYGCSSLASFEIPESETGISKGTFNGCKSLKEITIHEGVTWISYYSFTGCESLSDVYYGGSRSGWKAMHIGVEANEDLLNAKIHYAKVDVHDTLDELTDEDYWVLSHIAYWNFDKHLGKTMKESLTDMGKWDKTFEDTDMKYSELCGAIGHWKVVDVDNYSNTNGFYGVTFANGDDAVVAYRGSIPLTSADAVFSKDALFDWVLNDLYPILANRLFSQGQYKNAIAMYENAAKGYGNIAVTGHSLGGGLADLISAHYGCRGVSMNAISILDTCYTKLPKLFGSSFAGVDKWNFVDHANQFDLLAGSFEIGFSAIGATTLKPVIIHATDSNDYDITKVVYYHGLGSYITRNAQGEPALTGRTGAFIPSSTISNHMATTGTSIDLGTSGNNFINKGLSVATARTSYGGDGHDTISSNVWNDTIIGGKGSDDLDGSWGDDTYAYYKGDGVDIIHDIGGDDRLILLGFDEDDTFSVVEDPGSDYICITNGGKDIVRISKKNREYVLFTTNRFKIVLDHGNDSQTEVFDITDAFDKYKSGQHLYIGCPVHVEVLDPDGNVVYTLTDGEVGTWYTEYGNFYVFEEENGEYGKVLDLVEGYTARIVGADEGTMDVTYQVPVDGELTDPVSVSGVPVTENLTATIEETEDGDVYLVIDEDSDGETDSERKLYGECPFTDVPEGSFYYEPVMWAVEEGITNGATETTYNPNGTCLRAQVVTFLHRADGNPEPTSTRNPFTDVKSGDFFYKPVLWAVEKGITNGTSATTFGSYANCNRAAVVTFLWRAAGSPEPESTANPFVDVKATDFFYKPVLWAVENGITNGVDATHFGPTADCNRAQVVTFLYRAFN